MNISVLVEKHIRRNIIQIGSNDGMINDPIYKVIKKFKKKQISYISKRN
jgi:hypothetical protein